MSSKDSQCFKSRELTVEEHIALQSLYIGAATEYQQRLALKVIVDIFARTHDILYMPGSFDQSAFMAGRGFVGAQILKYIGLPVGKLRPQEENNNV